jgi:hypothetical protein
VEEAQEAARAPLVHLRALVEWNVVERAGAGRFWIAPMDRYFAAARGE